MAVDWRAVDLEYAHFNDAMFAWCLAELREKAMPYEATGLVPVYDVTPAVSQILENVQRHAEDWHPGSDGKVLDLVHPSLYPLYSIKTCGTGQTMPAHAPGIEYEHRYMLKEGLFSNKFQWLPCEVDIQDGKPAITSYINNLHPKHHAGLYVTNEKVIEKSLPLWDFIYRWHKDFKLLRIRCKEVGADCQAGCTDFCSQENRPLEPDEDERNIDKIWFERTHPIKMPSVPDICPMRLQPKDVNLEGGLLDDADRIQVIVKLANIQLTPEKPTYDNVTENRLAFRTNANKEKFVHSGETELMYEPNEFDSLDRTFKIDSRGSITQDLGSVLTREDRLLAFPNVYEHCVAQGWMPDSPLGPLPSELTNMVFDHLGFPISLEQAKKIREELMAERTGAVNSLDHQTDYWTVCEH
ncbi:hypothetical protein LZ31DRAFT_568317 [Colletotrichum somersetense]|nr:hypothetical protein LZ31DRAFT_568317 [Colletotrichum somersetense]